MLYHIPEQNMDNLTKSVIKFKKKCEKLGCEFCFNIQSEDFEELKDENGKTYIQRFFNIELDGKAIINDWEMVSVLEYTGHGNLVHCYCSDIEIPKEYKNAQPFCEHCHTKRYRKATFLLYNRTLKEYKLVGSSCLKDFLGVDASSFGWRYELIKTLEENTNINIGHSDRKTYRNTTDYLYVVEECIRIFGFVSKSKAEEDCVESTSSRAIRYMNKDFLASEPDLLDRKNYCPYGENNIKIVQKALDMILSYENKDNNEYIENLKTISQSTYVENRHLGLVASLMGWYHRELAWIEKQQMINNQKEAQKKSNHVGKIGETIILKNAYLKLLKSFEGQYGTTYLYQIVQEDNIFIWFTGNDFDDDYYDIKGKIKDHKLYDNTIKQTVITRCRVSKTAIA